MQEPTKLLDQINSHSGLFVNYVAQVGNQELVLFFSEARVKKDVFEELTFNKGTEYEVSLTDLNPIVVDDSSKKYRATFKRFLIYQVVEESCISWDDAEVFEGKLIRTFTKSRFLDHVDSHMNIDWYKEVPEMKYSHFQVCGLDFIVDVAVQEPPVIAEVEQFLVQ